MFIRRKHREVPELNTTSTADISFMLLVFFLVTSSMDSDKGLGRMLAPKEDQQEQQDIHRSDVMQIRLTDADSVYCDDKAVSLAELQQQVESFLASRQTDNYVLNIETGRKSSYDAYFEVQNAIVAAYKKLHRHPIKIREGIRDE